MTRKFLYIGLIILVPTLGKAQSGKPTFFFGLDLFRSVPTYFQRGFTLEPSIMVQTKGGWIYDLAVGVTKISHSRIYTNMDYRNEGNYIRVAVRRELGANFDLGLGLGYSDFNEFGTVIFADALYGDYTLSVKQSNQIYFLEPSLSYKLKLSARFTLIPQYRMPIILSSYNEQAFPIYAAPGVGDMQLFGSADAKKSSPSTIAVSLRITYNIFKN